METYPLLVATSNLGKMHEIRAILSGLDIEVKSLTELSITTEVDEDQPTFMGNAIKKARHYYEMTGLMTLADDSGLEVDILQGRPGVHSARFAGDIKDDIANNAKLIGLLRNVPLDQRTARFRCAMALVGREGLIGQAEGTLSGLIIDQPRGDNGFGYDPHFLIPEIGQTTAELSLEQKNQISHRGQTLRQVGSILTDWINQKHHSKSH